MKHLPPQINATSKGMDALVLQLPRANVHWIPQWVLGPIVVLIFLFVLFDIAMVYVASEALILALFIQIPALIFVLTRYTAFVHLKNFTVTLERKGLTIDEEFYPWHNLESVGWECDDPTTKLVLILRTGAQHRYLLNRRNVGDSKGITRKQRTWLEDQANAFIEASGSADTVPSELRSLEKEAR